MEYERDRRMIGQRKGRYGCMTGMAAMRDVKAHYDTVYDPPSGMRLSPPPSTR